MRIMRFVKPDARKIPFAALILVAWLIGACNLSAGGAETIPPTSANRTSIASGIPTITIISPAPNSAVVLGSPVLISVQAADTVGVSRVQLFINDRVEKTVSSESSGGDRSLSAVLDFRPTAAGNVNVRVVAYRGAVASNPAQIVLTVSQQAPQSTATFAPGSTAIVGPVINPNDPTCRVLINTGLNLRGGPGTEFPILTTLAAGSVPPVVGRTASNTWYQVRVNTTIGWVSGQFIAQYGNCTLIPVVVAPQPIPRTATFRPPTLTSVPPTSTLTLTAVPPTLTATPGLPDLVITSINGPQTLSLGAGDTPVIASFSVTITNTGSGPTVQFNNTVNVSPPSADTPLGVVGGLSPGESIVLNIAVPFNAVGTYSVTARADSDSIITEVSEVNNSGTLNVTITPSA